MIFGTKAETLEQLEGRLRTARVLPQRRFTVQEWRVDRARVLAQIGWDRVIVRSSARDEDGLGGSQAGRYPSVPDCGPDALRDAIDTVAAGLAPADQIFVQPYLASVAMAGVIVTRDPSNGAHYTIVSYDADSGRTDGITSGRARNPRTWIRHARATDPAPDGLVGVLALAEELQAHTTVPLDIEFAVDDQGVVLLQVRPLVLAEPDLDADGEHAALRAVAASVARLGRPHPYLLGARTVFGTMPDWNPAEVIGVRPRPLALSLYKELVTDSIWAYQRSNYGYRNVRSFPLLVSFAGLPYIDVRVSFNSFVPADLDADLGRRLVDHYIDRLVASPGDHDKVEFAIVHSCYTLDLHARLAALPASFGDDDRQQLASSLRSLTNRAAGLLRTDLGKLRELERRQAVVDAAGLDVVGRIYWLLEDCKRYGTLPFAGIARAAFMAVQLLDSLVAVGILGPADREALLGSLTTVRGRMLIDLHTVPREAFLKRYGHLRPGTYAITSPRYDEAPDAYFDWDVPPEPREERTFALSDVQREQLDAVLAEHGLHHDADSLMAFVRDAIEGRELGKFVFTRSLSDVLVLLEQLGAQHGLSRQDMAFADIGLIAALYSGTADPGQLLAASIEEGKRRFAVTRQLTLPPLLTGPDDVFAFSLPVSEPSFVTMGSAEGPVVLLEDGASGLEGGVALIPSADPGHDWIFSHGIAGFITMYGGYNSHMAIRAGELGIPAVIGAGETLYRGWASANRLRIDCVERRVEVLG